MWALTDVYVPIIDPIHYVHAQAAVHASLLDPSSETFLTYVRDLSHDIGRTDYRGTSIIPLNRNSASDGNLVAWTKVRRKA